MIDALIMGMLVSPCMRDLEDSKMNNETPFYVRFAIVITEQTRVSLQCPGYEFVVTKIKCEYVCIMNTGGM